MLARSPADAEARVTLGKIFFRRADYEQARVTFDRVLEYDDANEQAHFYLGEIERASQRFEEAAHHYQKADSAAARKELEAFRSLKAFEERKEKLELAILERPAEADSYRPLIELYLEHGRGTSYSGDGREQAGPRGAPPQRDRALGSGNPGEARRRQVDPRGPRSDGDGRDFRNETET